MPQLISRHIQKPLTPEERQRHLIKASNDYITGKISRADFRNAERQYMTDYDGLTLELGRVSRMRKRVFGRLAQVITRGVKRTQ